MIQGDYTNLQTPLRSVKGKVVLRNSDTTITYSHTDNLKSFKIERTGESGKFFGFGVKQKLTVQLLDTERIIVPEDKATIIAYLNANDDENYQQSVTFYVDLNETKRDEKTNELTIVAYDALQFAAEHTFSELGLTPPYTALDIFNACAEFITDGATSLLDNKIIGMLMNLNLEDGANYEGTETLKEVLDDVAEAAAFIYYVNNNDELTTKRILNTSVVLTIDKSQYFELESGETHTLAAICHATELGDNLISESATYTGDTQYIRDNGILTAYEDVATRLNTLVAVNAGTTLQVFNCKWRGNYFLEIGDKIEIVGKNNSLITSNVVNDVMEYNGSLSQTTSWEYATQEETEANPSTLGDAIKQTYAKVDKANKQIEMVASEASANKSAISALQLNTEGILASVTTLETATKEALEANTADIAEIKNSTAFQMTDEKISMLVQSEISDGVNKVSTSTGVTVDDRGLTIDKSNSELNTTISDDGMTIYKDNEEDNPMLQANNVGVKARNLHATTYLIVGTNSRFEDYSGRTGCFWIGGNS